MCSLTSRLAFLFFASLAWIGSLSPGHAQSEGSGKVVRVGYSQFPGYSFVNSSGVGEGYSIDLIRLLLEPQGYKISFLPYQNPTEVLDALARGDIDMTSLLANTSARRQYGTFTDTIGSIDVKVMVADGSPVPATTEDLAGLRIGAADGSIGWRLLSEIDGITPVPMHSGEALLLPLLAGDLDAIVGSIDSVMHQANRAELSHRVLVSDIALNVSPIGLLTRNDATALRDDLNSAISRVLSSGERARLKQHWFAARAAPITGREALVVKIGVVLCLCLLAYWARLHYGVLRRAKRLEARSNLFADTLDATGSSLVIFNTEMRPQYWNSAFTDNYPRQTPLIKAGKTMEELLTAALQNGSSHKQLPADEAAIEAKKLIAKIRAGGDIGTLNTTEAGRVLRHRTFMLPNMQFATLATDVTELVQAQRELEHKTDALKEANDRLLKFSHIAAHDLVAPLRTMRNLSSWIRDDLNEAEVELDEQIVQNLDGFDTLIERQTQMIEDLLAYSSLDRAEVAKTFDPVERYPSVLALANIPKGFHVSLPSKTPHLKAHPGAFEMVLRNLVSNAVKHQDRERGIVKISTRVDGDMCVFEVSDDGPGIPSDMLEKVFEPFARLNSRRQGGGSGLGLSFIKRSVTEWGGSVQAISQDGQRGTTFRFSVPLAEPKDKIDFGHLSGVA